MKNPKNQVRPECAAANAKTQADEGQAAVPGFVGINWPSPVTRRKRRLQSWDAAKEAKWVKLQLMPCIQAWREAVKLLGLLPSSAQLHSLAHEMETIQVARVKLFEEFARAHETGRMGWACLN
jgi:hypothetical protein